MPPRDPAFVQLDFPQLTADIIAELRLIGTVGLLNFVPEIRPVYIVASRAGALTFQSDLPVYSSAEITSGQAANPAVNTVVGDTGALAAGDYDIFASMAVLARLGAGANARCALEHRNAANTVTLATLLHASFTDASLNPMFSQLPLTGYSIALNERLRFIVLGASMVGNIGTTVGARLRPTP